MPTDASHGERPCRTLGEYVAEPLQRLGEVDPGALHRIRQLVGGRRARLALDAEAIDVWFAPSGLRTEPAPAGPPVDGVGRTDRSTTFAMLDGHLEVTEAILDGRLHVEGDLEAAARMFQAIEVLLDGATRIPALQALAREYREDPCRPPAGGAAMAPRPRIPVRYDDPMDGEEALLRRLDLLP